MLKTLFLNFKEYIFLGALILILTFVRSFTWNENMLNIDELDWIYLLHQIKQNPIPFLGFTAHTSGPLSIFILGIIHFFISIPTLASLRIFQLFFCIIPVFFFLRKSVKNDGKHFSVIFLFLLHFLITGNNNDYLAYNNEYLIMLFCSIIYYLQLNDKPKIGIIFLNAFFIVCLFWIKSQAWFFVGYFTLIYSLQLYVYAPKKMLFFWFSAGSIFSVTLFLLYVLGAWEAFKYEYVIKNIIYANPNEVTPFSIQFNRFIKFLINDLLFYWYLILATILLILLNLKNTKIEIKRSLIKASLLLLITLLTLFVSKNNYPHYKVLLFFPLSLIFGELVLLIKPNLILSRVYFSFIVLLFSFINKEEIKELLSIVRYNKIAEYKLNLGIPPLMTVNDELKEIDLNERKNIIYLLNQKHISGDKIHVLGWFIGLGFYYELLKKYEPISRSATSQYLERRFNKYAKSIYTQEEKILIGEYISQKPRFILDSENVLLMVKNQFLENFVTKNYHQILKSKHFTLWQINE